jgi:hypothetical protein
VTYLAGPECLRRRKLLVVLAGLTVAAAGAFVLRPQPSRVTLANFARIQQGMNQAEVRAILGEPGDYRLLRANEDREFDYDWDLCRNYRPNHFDEWYADAAAIEVVYDDEFTVTVRRIGTNKESFLGQVQRLWRRWLL